MTPRQVPERVKLLMVHPRQTLPWMLAESGTLRDLLVPYVLLVAAVAPLAGFLSLGVLGLYQPATTIFNHTIPGSWVRLPGPALLAAVVRFAVQLGGFWLFGTVLAKLAPRFGGREDAEGGLKASACAATPLFLAGALTLFQSVPHLDWLLFVGLTGGLTYGIVIAIWAAPLLLAVPEQKAPMLVLSAAGLTVLAVIGLEWLLALVLLSPFTVL